MTRGSQSSKVPSYVGVTREKDGAGDLGMVTRARKRRMVVRNNQKEVRT